MSTKAPLPAYADPHHPGNGTEHLSGRTCIEKGCPSPAGTLWSPFWCHPHNVERMEKIGRSLETEIEIRSTSRP